MKIKLLTFVFVVIFSQMLFAEETENLICENAAGECTYREGSNDIQCICADQEKNAVGSVEDGADKDSCKSTLEEICGTEVPSASELCETSENLENCEEYMFVVGNCFEHDYTQEDVDEYNDGGFNRYSRYVTSCCYSYSRGKDYSATMQEAVDCIESKGCVEECIGSSTANEAPSDDEITSEQDDSSNETSNTEESESSDSDGCSILMI